MPTSEFAPQFKMEGTVRNGVELNWSCDILRSFPVAAVQPLYCDSFSRPRLESQYSSSIWESQHLIVAALWQPLAQCYKAYMTKIGVAVQPLYLGVAV